MVTVGVLALQGGVREHTDLLQALGATTRRVRTAADLAGLDGLILPGGESTTMRKLLDVFDLFEPVRQAISAGLPTLATCAGMILLSSEVENSQSHFGLLDISVQRNGYGSQIESGEVEVVFSSGAIENVAFIRAPKITRLGAVQELAKLAGEAVAVKSANILAASFHPELTGSTTLHEMLIDLCETV